MKALFKACLDLLYPRHCLNCDTLLIRDYLLLCAECWQEMPFSDAQDFCRSCYSPLENINSQRCEYCRKYSSPFYRLLSTYDNAPPTLKLRNKFNEASSSFLAKALAALMTYRFAEQKLPWPDLIIPLPMHRLNRTYKGFSSNETLANELSFLLSVPYQNALIQKGLLSTSYHLASTSSIEDKCLLLISDSLTPAFFQAGESLVCGGPRLILGLTFCHSMTKSPLGLKEAPF